MTRTRIAAVLTSLLLAAPPAFADFDRLPTPPPLPAASLPFLNLLPLPGSNFSTGWIAFRSVAISPTQLLRVCYRRADGLLLVVMESSKGEYLNQSRTWFVGAGYDQLDVTALTQAVADPFDWRTDLVVFLYASTGSVARWALPWAVFPR